MRINANHTVITAQSLAANYTSQALDVHRTQIVGLQAEVTQAAALSGTLALLGRIGTDTGTFVAVPAQFVATPAPSITANGASQFLFLLPCPYDALQLQWTRTAGSGILTVCLRTKEPGY